MNPVQNELLEQAQLTTINLCHTIRKSHKLACAEDRLLELILREVLRDAMTLQNRIDELQQIATEPRKS